MYIKADVCHYEQMKNGISRAKELFGEIHGVIHAAGVSTGKIILEKDIKSFNEVLGPKINGTLVLDEVLKDEKPDFICYFSSTSAILGDFGSCDYAVGNRFLMAYADCRNLRQSIGETMGRAFVINWPLWKDGGMGFDDDGNTKMYLKSSGQRLLETGEGIKVFENILSGTSTQYMVLVGQPSRIQRFLGLSCEKTPVKSPPSLSPDSKGRRPGMKGLSIEQCVELELKEQVSIILQVSKDKLDRERNLADFGFDSISLGEFAAALTKQFKIDVTPAIFFGYSTIERLVHYFLTEYNEKVSELYKEDIKQGDKEETKHDTAAKSAPAADAAITKRREAGKGRFITRRAESTSELIAVIGMSGRFPGARNIHEMWDILAEGRNMVGEFPPERFDWRIYESEQNAETRKKWYCGCIPGVSEFDPLFFEISPKEAETMDPRQRLLLQEAWKALEDAGYGSYTIKKSKIGMFVGAEDSEYGALTGGKGGITANHNAILSARLPYFMNFSGPNMAINTACSSGLVAVHQACLSLKNDECDTAIAAGISLMLNPAVYIGMYQAGMLSEDGKCYAFDKRAGGMVPGEAVAVVVLKRLSRAEADGDPIYAVISGSGINFDGKTNGITAPNGVAQADLIKSVYDRYSLNPEDIDYIVAHGTGTKLGDPVEVNALNDAFKNYTGKKGYCALTSNKTNFGHTLAASGLVSLINLVQALKHEIIPASLNCEQENDFIKWQDSPFYVNKINKPWPEQSGKVRTGAVSAFGMSGTNVHLVLQSYTEKTVDQKKQVPYYLLAFSAKTPESLAEKIEDMIKFLENARHDIKDLSMVSHTLLEGRYHMKYRCAVVVEGIEDTIYTLEQFNEGDKLLNLYRGDVPRGFKGQEAIKQYIKDMLKQSTAVKEDKARYRELLCALAELYCQGYEIGWERLFEEGTCQRVHLPTYPFSKEHYWVSNEGDEELETKTYRMNAHSGQPVSGRLQSHREASAVMENLSVTGLSQISGMAMNEGAQNDRHTAPSNILKLQSRFENRQSLLERLMTRGNNKKGN